MSLKNCDLTTFCKGLCDKKIVLFGAGQALNGWIEDILVNCGLDKKIKYIVDNGAVGKYVTVGNCEFLVHHPKKIKDEKNIIILITNLNYTKEIYEQILDMNLDDSVITYIMPFIMAISCGEKDYELDQLLCNIDAPKRIERTINTFWFSNDPIPDCYKQCVESWYKFCPDYNIKIWNRESYDCEKIVFMRQALECKKWAFVSDYARVDVLHQNGGIYLDMDVEILKPLDPLLGNRAFFSYDMHNNIGLEIFGTEKNNPLLKQIKEKYEDAEFDINRMIELAQPKFIRNIIRDFGVRLDGNMQNVDGMIFVPRNYFNPQDSVIYECLVKDKDSFTIHKSNVSWKDQDMQNNAVRNARELWRLIDN